MRSCERCFADSKLFCTHGMNKKELSERDTRTNLITQALRRAGWDETTQLREEVSFTKDRSSVPASFVPAERQTG